MLRLALISIPSFLAALLPSLFIAGAVGGALWIWVYGDNTWPALAEIIIVISFVSSWAVIGALLTRHLYRHPRVQKLTLGQLVLLVVLFSVLAVGVLFLHQWLNGNLSSPHPCSSNCQAKGFSSSVIEYGDNGEEKCTCL
jgi:DMSO reductase anchor subunit